MDNINQFYRQSHTIRNLSLSVEEGKCTCIMGRNGVGKTTLCKVIMGLLPTRDGSIFYQGKNIQNLPDHKRASVGIGYVPQGRDVFPQLSVRENLAIGVMANPRKPKDVPEKIYKLFPVLKEMKNRRGGDLSGGQQQQLAIARALCIEPKVLILDEPGEGIQPNIVAQIGKVIDYLTKEDTMTVVLVEQKLPFARKHADVFYIMERGNVVANGNIAELNDNIIDRHLSV